MIRACGPHLVVVSRLTPPPSPLSPLNAYLETAVLTAPPARLHGMIADAAVRHAAAAAAALAAGDREGGHRAAGRATACCAELIAGLDPRAAGGRMKEVTDALAGQFAFCLGKLSEADRTGEAAPAADAARVLAVHAATWRELLLGSADAAPATAAAVPATAPAAFGDGGDEPVARSWAA